MRLALALLLTGCSVTAGTPEPSRAQQAAVERARAWERHAALVEARKRQEPALQAARRAKLDASLVAQGEPPKTASRPTTSPPEREVDELEPEPVSPPTSLPTPARFEIEPRRLVCRDGTVSACVCGGPRATCCRFHDGVAGCE